MPFDFSVLCGLLNELDKNRTRKTALNTPNSTVDIFDNWFNKHDRMIPREGPGAVAFLSCLFPERRPDRVFNLQEKRLESIIVQAQGLGATRLKQLQRWRTRDGADFASCVEHLMSATDAETRCGSSVTLEELDETLDRIAATSSFSSIHLRERMQAKYSEPIKTQDTLARVFRRLHSSEAKWMIRLITKTYSPVHIPETLAMQKFHFLLPDALSFQNSFEAAVRFLSRASIRRTPAQPTRGLEALRREGAVRKLTPQVGVMVTRPTHDKARSITHCCQLARGRRLSVERKYDGEYCQVHINLGKGMNCIKIFSKSGRDSTEDRIGLHGVLRDCLSLESAECKIKEQCILEGELLVWSDRDERIEPFYKIRKHVRRSGRFLGTDQDSPPDLHEHLMIMFYDLLLLDNVCYTTEGHDARREQLCSLVHCIPGRADIGSRENIDFSSRRAPEQLREAFARAITQRWEGLVLKGRDDPYYSFSGNSRFIKLKKDYIHGLGDTVDLAIVGGRRDPIDEQELGMGKLRWTSFYIGCLENKNQVCRLDVKPIFRIIDKVDRHGITKKDILFLNRLGYFEEVPFALSTPKLDVRLERGRLPLPTDLFKHPFIVDVMGAGFDKPANTRFFALRFPRVQKIHQDRTIKDTVGFEELQELARQSMEVPQEEESENRNWLAKLKGPDPTSNSLVTSTNLPTSYNLVPKGSKTMNKPGCSIEWRDQKQEEGKVKTDSPLFDGIPFQRSKRTVLLEGS
jgi:DNA ligase-4